MKISKTILFGDSARISVTTTTGKDNKTHSTSTTSKGTSVYLNGFVSLEFKFTDETDGYFSFDSLKKNMLCRNITNAILTLKPLFQKNEYNQPMITDPDANIHIGNHFKSMMYISPVIINGQENGFRLYPNDSIHGGWVMNWYELKALVDLISNVDLDLYSMTMINLAITLGVQEAEQEQPGGERGDF